ncbi:MAG: ABC transporter permease [Candidatus ainarchaeum sp.]|nr:ABC transporter permease [Candidatus ainarchaeum sp.]
MNLKDSFRLSVNSIMHRRLRAWLTLLGIIIGVAAVVAIISIGEGAQASVASRLSGLGGDIITISAGGGRGGFFGGSFREGNGTGPPGQGSSAGASSRTGSTTATSSSPKLTKRDVLTIKQNSNVLFVNGIVSGRSNLVFLSEQSTASIEGIDPNAWQEVSSSLEIASGRFLNSSDSAGIVIGDRIANETFKEPVTLGRKITLEDKDGGSQPFTVVGILKPSGSGFGGSNSDSTVFMTQDAAWNLVDVNRDVFSSIQVKADNADNVGLVTADLTSALLVSRRVTEKTQDFTITSAEAIQEQVSSVTDTMTLFLGGIAAISLLVGAVGVANSMFTSVLEKTREIGILKALGSTNPEILRLFIIESGLFGLAGGIIGVILGTIASLLMSGIGIGFGLPGIGGGQSGLQTLVTPQLVAMAIALSTIIGIVSGVMPARAAAQLRPVEALRYE